MVELGLMVWLVVFGLFVFSLVWSDGGHNIIKVLTLLVGMFE